MSLHLHYLTSMSSFDFYTMGHKGDVRSIDDFSLLLSMEFYYEVLENDKFCERKTLFCFLWMQLGTALYFMAFDPTK